MKLLSIYVLIAFVIPALVMAIYNPVALLFIQMGLVIGPLGMWVIARILTGKW